MHTVNVSQFERHPQWSVDLVVIQYHPYAEGVRLIHRPTGRYYIVVTDLTRDIYQVIARGRL